jgi:hypothetical protein|tara:strand:+ start:2449 stop:2631 length:183 start_codon:yes stop_codon:yes gene_type:complete
VSQRGHRVREYFNNTAPTFVPLALLYDHHEQIDGPFPDPLAFVLQPPQRRLGEAIDRDLG